MGETRGDTTEKTSGKTLGDIRQKEKHLCRKKPEGIGPFLSTSGFFQGLMDCAG